MQVDAIQVKLVIGKENQQKIVTKILEMTLEQEED